MKIYRIEKPDLKHGMWYNHKGEYSKTIDILCPNGIAKDLPMPLNLKLHRKDGLIWQSAMDSAESAQYWFTPEDAKNLMNNGFKLFEFNVNLFLQLENEILFCRQGIISQKEIPLEKLWNI